MQIIFGRENAEKLKEKYTVLDLETITIEDDKTVDVFCLIPAESLSISDLPMLEKYVQLHNDFLNGYAKKEYEYCRQCIGYLRGQFGGEVDTFYDEILRRINEAEQTESD